MGLLLMKWSSGLISINSFVHSILSCSADSFDRTKARASPFVQLFSSASQSASLIATRNVNTEQPQLLANITNGIRHFSAESLLHLSCYLGVLFKNLLFSLLKHISDHVVKLFPALCYFHATFLLFSGI